MRLAIDTEYKGPTDHRGARIIARCDAGRATVPWNYALNVDENHRAAARVLADRLGWAGTWVGGWSIRGTAWVMLTWDAGDVSALADRVSTFVVVTQ